MKISVGRENIQEFWARCKGLLDILLGEWGVFALILLSILVAFTLGRLSVLVEAKPLIEVHEPSQEGRVTTMLGGQFVAALGGTVYYFPWCGGADKIATKNQRWFASEAAAKAAGYRAAKNCKGLE